MVDASLIDAAELGLEGFDVCGGGIEDGFVERDALFRLVKLGLVGWGKESLEDGAVVCSGGDVDALGVA